METTYVNVKYGRFMELKGLTPKHLWKIQDTRAMLNVSDIQSKLLM